jgi:hypothetical protein
MPSVQTGRFFIGKYKWDWCDGPPVVLSSSSTLPLPTTAIVFALFVQDKFLQAPKAKQILWGQAEIQCWFAKWKRNFPSKHILASSDGLLAACQW